MSEVKEFVNIQAKNFYEVCQGTQKINLRNFDDVNSMIRSINSMNDRRTEATKLMLKLVTTFYQDLNIPENQYRLLVQDPLSFKLRVPEDSTLKEKIQSIQELLSQISQYNNDFFMNYKACYLQKDFLINRNNDLTEGFNKLVEETEKIVTARDKFIKEEIKTPLIKQEKLDIAKTSLITTKKEEEELKQLSEEDVEEEFNEAVEEDEITDDPMAEFNKK